MPKKGGLPRRPWQSGAGSPDIQVASHAQLERHSWPVSNAEACAEKARLALITHRETAGKQDDRADALFQTSDHNQMPGQEEEPLSAVSEAPGASLESTHTHLETPLHEHPPSPLLDIAIPTHQQTPKLQMPGYGGKETALSLIELSPSTLSQVATPCANICIRHGSKSPGGSGGRKSPLPGAIFGSPRFQSVKTIWVDEQEENRDESSADISKQAGGTPDSEKYGRSVSERCAWRSGHDCFTYTFHASLDVLTLMLSRGIT